MKPSKYPPKEKKGKRKIQEVGRGESKSKNQGRLDFRHLLTPFFDPPGRETAGNPEWRIVLVL